MQGPHALVLVWAVLAAGAPVAQASRAEENPLGQTINLLDSLAAKITREGEAEGKAYKEFVEWCDDTSKNKGFEIKTATAKKATLEAAIGKATGDAEASAAKIEELAADIATNEADLKSATTVRTKEAADFVAGEKELVETIDTLGRAIGVLEREMANNPAAFAQVDTSSFDGLLRSFDEVVNAASFSSADKSRLVALVQSQQRLADEDGELGAPAASVYKTHSTNIVEVLEDLKEKAEEQLSNLRKSEANAKHNFAMLKQSLEDETAADTKDLGEEKAAKAASEEAKATADSDLAVTVKGLADGKAALKTVNEDCTQTAADHEATVAARNEELKVIAEAKEILQSSTSGAVRQTYSMLQLSAARAGSRLSTQTDLANAEVVTLVKRLAQQHHSAALAQLAARIATLFRYGEASGEDPFAKVKGLLSDLIDKLTAEAGAEATEKAYCDEQMAKTEEKKSELEDDISKLTTKIDQAVAKSTSLKGEVKQLQEELAALAEQQAEMDKIRQESHAAYVQAKADLEAGLEGVRKAIGVLREYYGSSNEAAMLQDGVGLRALMQQPTQPTLHGKATGAGSSIIGLLEVVEADFAKNLAKEETEETDAAADYDKTTQENQVTKTLKDQDVAYKTRGYNGLDKSVAELSADHETVGAELSAVLEYYSKIKERCIAKPETYESRKGRRAAEIKGLKEALAILTNEVAFAQRGKRRLRSHVLDREQR